jgi:hypothetical protein
MAALTAADCSSAVSENPVSALVWVATIVLAIAMLGCSVSVSLAGPSV